MKKVNIQGIGKVNFPDYMSDDEITDAIKQKILPNYSNQSSQNAGQNQQQPSQLSSSTDIGSYLKSALGEGENFVTGFGNAVNRLPANLSNLVLPKNMQVPVPGEVEGIAGKLGGIGGDIATTLTGGGLLNTGRKLAESAPLVGKIAEYLGGHGILPTMARLGTGYGAYGAVMNPEDRTTGAIAGGALGAAGGGLSGAINALRPSRYLNRNLSPEQLAANLKSTEGTQTPLGDVIGSPMLKRLFENTVSKNPFSGADQKLSNIASDIKDKGQNILQNYLGDVHPEEVNNLIGKGLINAKQEADTVKNSFYDKANELANSAGVKINLNGLADKVKHYQDVINDQNFLKYEPDAKRLLNRLGNYNNNLAQGIELGPEGNVTKGLIVDSKGNVLRTPLNPSLQEANILASRLNSLSNKYRASPEPESRHLSSVLGDLGKTVKQDIRDSLDSSGNSSVKDAYLQAEENYKKNYSKFLDKDIYKFTNGNKDVDDILQTFIKTGSASDKGNQLNKLMSLLDPKTRDLVKYSYLSKSIKEGEFDPNAMKTALSSNKLGINQKNALFNNPDELKSLSDYSKLVGMNSEALTRMFNPKTGQRGLESALTMTHGLGGLLGATIGGHEEGAKGAFGGAIVGALLPSAGMRYLSNKLTSEAYRSKLVQKIIESQTKGNGSNKLAAALSPLLDQNIR